MAGYTRQSSFSDGDTITAALFNNEYNQLVNAFNVSSGHSHDGSTTGDGGPISNLFSNALVFGTNAESDIAITFNAASNDGVLTWKEDEDYFEFSDDLLIATTEKIQFRDTAIYINSSTDGQLDLVADTEIQIAATTVDINGNADISGNLGIGGNLTVTGTTTFNGGTITMGDAATDNVVFGADVDSNIIPDDDNTYDLGSSSQQWKDIYIDGVAYLDAIDFNGTTITSTASELNILDGVTASATDINLIDGVTNGTVIASKAIITDSNKDITGGRNITISGELDAGSLDVSGDVDVDGTLETDALSINGTTVTSTAAELNLLDGKAFLDEDNMASNSATGIASQQSIKAYVDTQITAEDLDITTDSGTIAIDLDSETLTVSGGTGLDSSATGNAVTLAIDSTVATLTGSQTLTNKSLTAPTLTGTAVVASLDISGDIDVDGTTNLDVVDIDGAVDFASTTAHAGNATFADNAKAIFGAGSDLQIYHDGSHSYLLESNATGNLYLGGDNLFLTNANATKVYVKGIDGGATELRHNNSQKLATTSSGVDVTGTLTATTLAGTLSTAAQPNITSLGTLASASIGSTLTINNTDSSSFGTIEISGTSGAFIDLKTPSSDDFDIRIQTTGAGGIIDTGSGEVTIKRQGSTKLATTSTGIDVTGTVTSDGLITTGNLVIGTEDNNAAILEINGNATGSVEGGEIRLDIAADYDGTYEFYRLDVSEDDFRIGRQGQTDLTINSSGNVGIGTSSPDEQLHISNAAPAVIRLERNDTSISSANTIGNIEFEHQESGGAGLCANFAVKADTGAGAGAFVFETGAAGTLTEKVRFTSAGLVGIGTSSPDHELTVGDANAETTIGVAGSRSMFGFKSDLAVMQGGAGKGLQFNVNNNTFGSGEAMRINSSGNVGIGTSNPSAPLHVHNNSGIRIGSSSLYAGLIKASTTPVVTVGGSTVASMLFTTAGTSSGSGHIGFEIPSNDGDDGFYIATDSNSDGTVDTLAMKIKANGNVGIGTSSPSRQLHVANSSNALAKIESTGANYAGIDFANTSRLWFAGLRPDISHGFAIKDETASAIRLAIDTSGNVGINEDTPLGKLHVKTADSSASPNTNGDVLVLEDSGSAGLSILSGTSADSNVFFGDSGNNVAGVIQYSHNGDSFRISSTGVLNLQTGGGNTRLHIDSTGKCGIGTTAPTNILHVQGTSNDTIDETKGTMKVQASGGNGMILGTLASSPYTSYIQSAYVQDTSVAQYNLSLNPIGGNVGIGTTSPAYKIDSRVSTSASIVAGLNLDASGNNNGDGSAISFSRANNVISSVAKISAVKAEVSNNETDLVFSNYASGSLTEKMRIVGATGNVGIGNTSPTENLAVHGAIQSSSTGNFNGGTEGVFIDYNSSTGIGKIRSASWGSAYKTLDLEAVTHVFSTGSGSTTERVRIDSDGNFLIGKTSIADNNVAGMYMLSSGALVATRSGNTAALFNRTTSDGTVVLFRRQNVTVGSISVTGSATTYATSSDYRLKENVDYDFTALDRVAQLKPARFNFIATPTVTVDGFLAHEVSDIVPEAITGEKDGTEMQGIDQSKLVPLLTKAMQEQQTIIDDLKSRIETLEG